MSGNWNEYQKLVLSKLEDHDKSFNDIKKLIQDNSKEYSDLKSEMAGMKSSVDSLKTNVSCIDEIKTDIAQLQVKSGIWGAAGGILGFLLVFLTTQAENIAQGLFHFFIMGC